MKINMGVMFWPAAIVHAGMFRSEEGEKVREIGPGNTTMFKKRSIICKYHITIAYLYFCFFHVLELQRPS